uniref:SNF2_N domain-containing protein n=1 Tax=Bursaphelenchus xylophilus TaxID=6326 RepID=A0A1I7SH30_BURXY
MCHFLKFSSLFYRLVSHSFFSTTQALVELLVENRILIHKIYSAPSFRCVETADLLTEALHPSANDGKVCVEPTFAEYDHFPEIPAFMKPKELSMYGLKVDESYKPLAKKIKERKEHSKDVHMRVKTVMNCLHKREPIRNPIAIVATPTILQNISSCLRRDRTGKDVPVDRPTAIRMSPPSMVQVLCYEERRWRLREDLMPKFDYKYGCNWK